MAAEWMYVAPGVHTPSVTACHVRLAYTVQLPFRLCTGKWYGLEFPAEEKCRIWFRNRADIPTGSDATGRPDLDRLRFTQDINTQAVIELRSPRLGDGDIEALRAGSSPFAKCSNENAAKAMRCLNEAIVGYCLCTRRTWGGQPIDQLTSSEFGQACDQEVWVLCHDDFALTPQQIEAIFLAGPPVPPSLTSFGPLDDVDAESLGGWCRAIQDHRSLIGHEYALRAQASLDRSDYRDALIMSVLAVEAAHCAFLRRRLLPSLGEKDLRDLLRELGHSRLNNLTPKIWMETDSRPSADEIRACKKAIETRNAIVHSLHSQGAYTARKFTDVELIDHSRAALRMYECFLAAIDRLPGGDTIGAEPEG